jgi:hypothetical protein
MFGLDEADSVVNWRFCSNGSSSLDPKAAAIAAIVAPARKGETFRGLTLLSRFIIDIFIPKRLQKRFGSQ